MLVQLVYISYWIVLGVIIYRYEKRVAELEEDNRHVKELLDIASERIGRQKRMAKNVTFLDWKNP